LRIEAMSPDGAAALVDFERLAPSIAFLDIEMPRVDGLQVARRIASRAHVVFITAYDRHALQAFDAGAVDYVLKPLDLARLTDTVVRLKARIGTPPPDLTPTLDAAGPTILAPRRHLQWINASQGNKIRMIMVSEICYFKADHKVTLVIERQAQSVIRKGIRELADALDGDMFWQIHRSTLVNSSSDRCDNRRSTMTCPAGTLSRRQLVALLAAFGIAPEIVDAQDAAKVDSRNYRVIVENERVRILEYTSHPGSGVCGVGRHSHPAHVTVQMTPVTVRVTGDDDRPHVIDVPAGAIFYEPAIVHVTENLGGGTSQAYVIELKDAAWHPASGTS
jgi:DNA-binding LytR/AlgR family response regulator